MSSEVISSDSSTTWKYWAPIWNGEFADFKELEDVINVIMSLTCILCAALG